MPDYEQPVENLGDDKFSWQHQAGEQGNFSSRLSNEEQGMVLQLADGTIRACNPAAERILGLTAELLIGRTFLDASWQAICEDGSLFPSENYPAIVALQTGKPCVNVVMGLYQPNGELVWLSINSQPLFLPSETTPYAVITNFTDITASVNFRVPAADILRSVEAISATSGQAFEEDEAALAEVLRESPQLIQQIADTTPGTLYVYDLVEQRIIYISRQVEILGYTQEEIQTTGLHSLFQRMHPNDYVRLSTHYQRLISATDGEVVRFQFQYQHASSEWHWLCSYDTVLTRTANGLPKRIIGFCEDVTERRRTELALRESNERFELAAAAVNCLIYDWDIEKDTVERTQGLTQLLGYTLAESEPTSDWWRSRIHPDDLPVVEDSYMASLAKGNRFCTQYRIRHKDGYYVWVEDRGLAVRDAGDRIIRMIGTTTDISDRKQAEADLRESEERFRLATAAAELGMWFWDLTTNELVWTAKCKALFGLAANTKISYELFLDCLHPEDRQRTHEAVTRSLEEKIEYDIEYRTIWPNGSVHWIAAKGRGIYDDFGKPVRMMGTAQDITQRKETEEALKQQTEELAQANSIKDQFLAILSHELRSPLNPILGWTKLLKTRNMDAQATTRALDTIERNAKLQIQLIDDLLDVSRILRGKLSINIATVDLATVIDAALETVRLAAETKSIQLIKQIEPNIGKVSGDFNRLQQVVSNLLSNAVKFTPTGGRVEVRLKVEIGQGASGNGQGASGNGQGASGSQRRAGVSPVEATGVIGQGASGNGQGASGNGQGASGSQRRAGVSPVEATGVIGQGASDMGKKTNSQCPIPNAQSPIPNAQFPIPNAQSPIPNAQITVTDTGSGISPEFLPYVFEYFRQADSSTTRRHGGLGLGLAIVRNLVELHGGTVTADSRGEGQGASFIVRLPLKQEEGQGEGGTKGEGEKFSSSCLSGLRILVVDDDTDTRQFLSFFLQEYGAAVTIAASANEAITALAQTRHDLLISDVGMPEVDGYGLISKIRVMPVEQGGKMPAIALTAYVAESDRARVLATGFQMHLAKPLDGDKLLESIADLVKNETS